MACEHLWDGRARANTFGGHVSVAPRCTIVYTDWNKDRDDSVLTRSWMGSTVLSEINKRVRSLFTSQLATISMLILIGWSITWTLWDKSIDWVSVAWRHIHQGPKCWSKVVSFCADGRECTFWKQIYAEASVRHSWNWKRDHQSLSIVISFSIYVSWQWSNGT